MFRIAYSAGHYIGTPGKRIPESLDDAQTREWTLNDRVARHFARAALEYEDVELLRTDDSAGKTLVTLSQRAAGANRWDADLYLDIHHNAGVKGGAGGGVEAYCFPGSAKGKAYRDAIYQSVIRAGGLAGNRANPLQEKAFDILRMTKMPGVLMEYGFMDSATDVPVILSESYAQQVARATMEAIAAVAGLEKKQEQADYTREDFRREVQTILGAKTITVSAEKNSRHPVVAPIQRRLAALGYTQVGAADGIAGPKFTAAVKAFQRHHAKVSDGEITAGNVTWQKLLTL